MVVLTLWIATAIRMEATLSFLGLGTQAAAAELGQHHPRRAQPTCSAPPGRSSPPASPSRVTVLAFNMVGDAVRDVLDPEIAVT